MTIILIGPNFRLYLLFVFLLTMLTIIIMLILTNILIGPNLRLYLLFVFLLTWFS